MSVTVTQHADILEYKADRLYRSQIIRVCLSNIALTADSTLETIFASELLPINGYTRISQTLAADAGTYNSSTGELTLTPVTAQFAASGGSLQWQSAFAILGGSATASRSFTSSNVDAAINRITISNHGLTSGDRLLFTVEPTGTLPGGINSSTRYYVEVMDSNTIELHTTSALNAPLDITNTGSGTFHAHYADGRVATVAREDALVTLLDGGTYTYNLTLKERR